MDYEKWLNTLNDPIEHSDICPQIPLGIFDTSQPPSRSPSTYFIVNTRPPESKETVAGIRNGSQCSVSANLECRQFRQKLPTGCQPQFRSQFGRMRYINPYQPTISPPSASLLPSPSILTSSSHVKPSQLVDATYCSQTTRCVIILLSTSHTLLTTTDAEGWRAMLVPCPLCDRAQATSSSAAPLR